MIDAAWSDRLILFFTEMLEFYKKFLALESEKYTKVVSGQLNELDSFMKQEQAYLLKSRGMEQERLEILEKAGAPKASFREMIPLLEPARQESIRKLYEEITTTISKLQNMNKKCSQMTRLKLGQISRILSNLEDHPELKQIYGDKLQNAAKPEGTFSRKI